MISEDNVLIAKSKMRSLTTRVEKSLYVLRYCKSDTIYTVLDESLYLKLQVLCKTCNGDLTFPLVRKNGNIYLNEGDENLFKVLLILATEHNIILDYKLIA